MMAIDYIAPSTNEQKSIQLINENNRPTPALVGLAAAEVAVDVAIGFAAFTIFRHLAKK